MKSCWKRGQCEDFRYGSQAIDKQINLFTLIDSIDIHMINDYQNCETILQVHASFPNNAQYQQHYCMGKYT